mgnify:CR=1 FL=1
MAIYLIAVHAVGLGDGFSLYSCGYGLDVHPSLSLWLQDGMDWKCVVSKKFLLFFFTNSAVAVKMQPHDQWIAFRVLCVPIHVSPRHRGIKYYLYGPRHENN